MRLMIVDDSNMIRTRISRLVQNEQLRGVSVVALARDGIDAIRMCKSTQPELVTMDITMPQMDGLSAIKALVALKPGINILVVSALDDKSTAIAAIKAGARGFIGKPFTDQELQLALLSLVQDP